jgi:hypothetical protein
LQKYEFLGAINGDFYYIKPLAALRRVVGMIEPLACKFWVSRKRNLCFQVVTVVIPAACRPKPWCRREAGIQGNKENYNSND